MNRDYINWLETLPCNLNSAEGQRVDGWLGATT